MGEADRLRRELAARDQELAEARASLRIARLAAAEAEAELAAARAQLAALGRAAAGPNRVLTGRKRSTGRRPRRLPALPDGVFDATPEGHRALVRTRENLLLVDGYNLAREAWADLPPEVERARVIAILEELWARRRGRIVVVFDGASHESSPEQSRTVTVRFSATGRTADELLIDLLAAEPSGQPVVLVTSDRALGEEARRHGAVVLSSPAFLDATGR